MIVLQQPMRIVDIDGIPWDAVFVDDLGLSKEGRKILGQCNWKDCVLRFRIDQPPGLLIDTIIHEVIHALRPDYSEEVVTSMAIDISTAVLNLGETQGIEFE